MAKARVNGIEIDYQDTGRGRPVVLTHGHMSGRTAWDGQHQALADRSRVISWDIRGHGQTDAPDDPAQYSLELTVADIRALLGRLGIACEAVWEPYAVVVPYSNRAEPTGPGLPTLPLSVASVCPISLAGPVVATGTARSTAPMSQPVPIGRLTPRWSVSGQPAACAASTAALPSDGTTVGVSPPWSSRAPSRGSPPLKAAGQLGSASGKARLPPPSPMVPRQFGAALLATIVFVSVTEPFACLTPPPAPSTPVWLPAIVTLVKLLTPAVSRRRPPSWRSGSRPTRRSRCGCRRSSN